MWPDVSKKDVNQVVDEGSVELLAAFLSPSLSGFCIFAQSEEYVGFKHFHQIMEHLAERCPGLECITIEPGDKKEPDTIEAPPTNTRSHSRLVELALRLVQPDKVTFSNPCVGTERLISQFTCLHSLMTSSFALEDRFFMALSELPRLEDLSVVSGGYNNLETYGTNVELPPAAFPALRVVYLTGVLLAIAINICRLKPFMSNLDIFRLAIFCPGWKLIGTSDPPDIFDLLTAITSLGSSITKLTISGGHPWIITPEAIQLLKRLPLSTLYLGHVDYDTFDLEGLVCALPGLEELRLSSTERSAPFKHLRTIACSLLSLRHLSLSLSFESLRDIEIKDFEPVNPQNLSTIYFESDFYPHQHHPETSKAIANYLYRLWPQVRCVQAGDRETPRRFSERFNPGLFWDAPLPEQDAGMNNLEIITLTLADLQCQSKV